MSEDSKGSNGAPVATANGGNAEETQTNTESIDAQGTESKKDVVAYETYRKTLALAKRREAELEVERAEKQKLMDEKLTAEGKTAELLESTKKKLAETESKLKKAVGSFAHSSLAQSIEREAVKLGCINVRDLIQLSENALREIEVDDEFNANVDQVKQLVEQSKKDRPYLFSKTASAVRTGVPTSTDTRTEPDWVKLSAHEKAKLVANMMAKK